MHNRIQGTSSTTVAASFRERSFYVVARPAFGNLHKLPVAGHLVAVHVHFQAQAAVTQVHIFLFPSE